MEAMNISNNNNNTTETENLVIIRWWDDFYLKANNSRKPLPTIDPSVILHDLRIVVLLMIGCAGAFIVGCLLFCMFYKNERVLQMIPGTKEYKRREKEPDSFYPIPGLGSFTLGRGKTLSLLARAQLPGSRLHRKGIKPAISGLFATKDTEKTTVDDVNECKSDRSSLNESDGEYEAPDNTFPAGGEMEAKKKAKKKKKDHKRVKRHRKKNQFSTTIITSGELFPV